MAQGERKAKKKSIFSEKIISIYQTLVLAFPKVLSSVFLLLKLLSYSPHFTRRYENQFLKALVPLLLPFFFFFKLIDNVNNLTFMSVILNPDGHQNNPGTLKKTETHF